MTKHFYRTSILPWSSSFLSSTWCFFKSPLRELNPAHFLRKAAGKIRFQVSICPHRKDCTQKKIQPIDKARSSHILDNTFVFSRLHWQRALQFFIFLLSCVYIYPWLHDQNAVQPPFSHKSKPSENLKDQIYQLKNL